MKRKKACTNQRPTGRFLICFRQRFRALRNTHVRRLFPALLQCSNAVHND